MSERLRTEIIGELNDAWLNINVKDSDLIRPLDLIMSEDPNEFYMKFTWLVTQPDYFSFFCKHVLNIEILPFQALILTELWKRKFPMLIATRGGGKTFILALYALLRALFLPSRKIVVVGSVFRQSKYIYDYMETIWKNSPILRDLCDEHSGPKKDVDMCRMIINGSVVSALPIGDGCVSPYTQTTYDNGFGVIVDKKNKIWGNKKFRDIEYQVDNGVKPTKIVTTNKGYSYEGTHNHAMKVLRNSKVDWVRTDEMVIGDRILLDRSVRWHNGQFKCTNDDAYALGAMIGDGCWTSDTHLGFATIDPDIINRINSAFGSEFKQTADLVHWRDQGKQNVSDWLNFWGLTSRCYTINKTLPENILSAPREQMTACLQGLFDTDGHVFIDTSRGGTTISVNFTNTSEKLVKQIQYILLHYGIISSLRSRNRNENWNTVYELGIYGKNVKIFHEQINFHLGRKRDALDEAISNRKTWNSFDDDIPLISEEILKYLIPCKRGALYGKKPRPSRYSPSKIKKLKSFQQTFLQELLEFCDNPPWEEFVNQDIFYDEVVLIEDSECPTYDVYIPEEHEYCANGFFSHNSKIRGQRGHDILSDEFASMSRNIFENVIAGFAAVSASPAENVKRMAKRKKANELNETILEQDDNSVGNQIVIAGTAYYDFNHFAEYYKRWRSIILSEDDPKKLEEIFGEEAVPTSFSSEHYGVIRLPVDMLPYGFMDESQIARSKATVHAGIYDMEFNACFSKDSQGFFKRSLIESCVGTQENPVRLLSGPVFFDPSLRGNPHRQYIIGVDPASEVDNFSIVVLEINRDHKRIVYVWTTNKKKHTERVNAGLTDDNNFYSFCARKIRNLMILFPTVRIAMDSQGGGIAVREALGDEKCLEPGESPIYEIIEEDNEKDTDDKPGLHMLQMCNFANYEWLATANHGLRHDFENKAVIFPQLDPITVALSLEDDKAHNRLYDTLEDAMVEVEELKRELSLIEITKTATGRDKWDTPEIKIGVGKKERMRKDRYSALLLANSSARHFMNVAVQGEYTGYGGFAEKSDTKGLRADFSGPSWFCDAARNLY